MSPDFITLVAVQNIRPGYGPAPTVDGSKLTAAQWSVLATLSELGPDTDLRAMSAVLHLHGNTLRGHLDVLQDLGLVTRRSARPRGRGRPAQLYTASGMPHRDDHQHAALAASLATELASVSPDPASTAVTAGRRWGRDLARSQRKDRSSPPRQRVLTILADLGFAPRDDGDVVRLFRCPLLPTAREHTEIVCGVHTGLVEGALSSMGSNDAVALEPFAEPGCCRLLIS